MEEEMIHVDIATLRRMQEEADKLDANFRILSNYVDWEKIQTHRDGVESEIQWVKGILSRIENNQKDVSRSTLHDLAKSLETLHFKICVNPDATRDHLEFKDNRTGIENIGLVNRHLCRSNINQMRRLVNEILGIQPPVDPDEEEEEEL